MSFSLTEKHAVGGGSLSTAWPSVFTVVAFFLRTKSSARLLPWLIYLHASSHPCASYFFFFYFLTFPHHYRQYPVSIGRGDARTSAHWWCQEAPQHCARDSHRRSHRGLRCCQGDRSRTHQLCLISAGLP